MAGDYAYVRGVWIFDQGSTTGGGSTGGGGVTTPLSVTTVSPLPAAAQNSPYQVQLMATGGIPPYDWTVLSGTLPTGISLITDQLIGTPTTAGTSVFTVQVEDSVAARATKSLSLTALPPAPKTVELTWNTSSGIGTTYNVKRFTFNGGPYTTIATAVAATNYNDANVKSGLTYYPVVSAVASNGSETANSNHALHNSLRTTK